MTDKVPTKRLPLKVERDEKGEIIYRPRYVIWEMTLKCDQKCRFCGSRAGKPREDELTTDECLDVINQVADMGVVEISMHGGEAYLRPDWLTLVKAIRTRKVDATIVTGGRGITQEMAYAAKDADITAVSLSIDAPEDLHDQMRDVQGSFQHAISALEYLHEAGIPIGVNTQVNGMNFRKLHALFDILSQFPLYGWQVQLMAPQGRAADAQDLWLQPYEMLELMPILAELRARSDEKKIPLWPGDNVGYFGPYEHVIRKNRTRYGYSGGCSGGVLALGVEAHGEIKGCSAMSAPEFIGGNVRKQPIADIWNNSPALHFNRKFDIESLWGFCRTCYYAEICKGGCPWTASVVMGRRGNNPYCHHRAIELAAKGKRERLVLKKAALGDIRDRAEITLVEEDIAPISPPTVASSE